MPTWKYPPNIAEPVFVWNDWVGVFFVKLPKWQKKTLKDWLQNDFCDPGFQYMANAHIGTNSEGNKNEECEG
jgi:hypothetical protein